MFVSLNTAINCEAKNIIVNICPTFFKYCDDFSIKSLSLSKVPAPVAYAIPVTIKNIETI